MKTMTHPASDEPSNLMKAASDAANRVSKWSLAKQKFADKVAASASVQKETASSQSSRMASDPSKK
jgi:hypothetical protein